ncbi:Csa1 family protein [Staphylococcus pettenkoferi]|uniref:Csa1 family protein n=1 Tax=Staphylococcus pettenkoferi TaxID=170573 RepID=UPI0014303764|nr:Csa1 family protein [Staphylococcus pettenkoferi]MCY1620901.1 tandem-type lipoprotein [Staphylococcus pettenkoferi]
MNIIKKSPLIIILILILTTAIVCYLFFFEKERKIKNLFNEKLNIYPVKNLDDYYHLSPKGKYTKKNISSGTWIVQSSYSVKKGKVLFTEGAVLYINPKKKNANGKYYIYKTFDDEEKGLTTKETNYKIVMKENHLECVDKRADKITKKKIENFKFISQFAEFKNKTRNSWEDINYGYSVNSLHGNLKLNNNDKTIKILKEIYDVNDLHTPYISMSGNSSEFKKNKDIDVSLIVGFKNNKYSFSDSIKYDRSGFEGVDDNEE